MGQTSHTAGSPGYKNGLKVATTLLRRCGACTKRPRLAKGPPGDPPEAPPGIFEGIFGGILGGILPGFLRGILRGDTLGGPAGGAVNTPAPPRHVTLVAAAAVGFSAPVVAGRRWSLDVASGAGLLLSWLLCYMSFHGALSWSRPPLFNVIYNVN